MAWGWQGADRGVAQDSSPSAPPQSISHKSPLAQPGGARSGKTRPVPSPIGLGDANGHKSFRVSGNGHDKKREHPPPGVPPSSSVLTYPWGPPPKKRKNERQRDRHRTPIHAQLKPANALTCVLVEYGLPETRDQKTKTRQDDRTNSARPSPAEPRPPGNEPINVRTQVHHFHTTDTYHENTQQQNHT